jgi:glutamate dehydrogenase/leucine dehydrogenase
MPDITQDSGLAFDSIVGNTAPEDGLLGIVCERIRSAAELLGLSRTDLFKIFGSYNLFEGEVQAPVGNKEGKFLILEAHHLIQGKVGKGALKIIRPQDLARESKNFVEIVPRIAEVIPPAPKRRWNKEEEAWSAVKQFLRGLVTGETLSMSLKSQTTAAPFAGSEGFILCAAGEYDPDSGRFFLRSVLSGNDDDKVRDKELLETIMNSSAEVLSGAERIAHDRIVHAAETNSTLTSRLNLQLPTNVVEGHLRALLQEDPGIVIGDEDMTARLRKILSRIDYKPTECPLAKEAARMQLTHSILKRSTREHLRDSLAGLPPKGFPKPEQFREIVNMLFGSGKTQRAEDQIFHHREPILRSLSAALSTGRLDESGDPLVLSLYLRVLLDNQAKMMKAALMTGMSLDETLPADWFDKFPLLSSRQEADLAAMLPMADTSKPEAKRRFVHILEILTELKNVLPAKAEGRYSAARGEVIELAICAITSAGGIIPSVERIRFFVSPFTFECVTPKLGVVTRKPLEVCGSELRPEAMAAGAVYSMEAVLKRQGASKTRPLKGLTVAIQGLGNAGKGVARMMKDREARIIAVSDSRGAIIAPEGLKEADLSALLTHKTAGKRLDTYVSPETPGVSIAPGHQPFILHKNPDILLTVKADILVLTAMPAAIKQENAGTIRSSLVFELTGAAVTKKAKDDLCKRSISVIPDNLVSSGGLLASLSEMLQNSYGEQWERRLEEITLRQQIEKSHEAILKVAKKYGVDIATASDILALKRIFALAVYRENLVAASRRLREQILAVENEEVILIASDDDEDGVASAAILRGLIAKLNPGKESRILYLSASLRSNAILEVMDKQAEAGMSVKRLFVLDRAFPLNESGQQVATEIAKRCSITMINNHDLPIHLLNRINRGLSKVKTTGIKSPSDLKILLITPQTLKATVSARHFSTALVLKEIAHQLLADPHALNRIDWQAGVGSCLDISPETSDEWLLFYAQFNHDQMMEAARAVRMVARAHGFMSAIHAIEGVERPDQLETNKSWKDFMGTYKLLAERIQLLVEKIVMENIGRRYVSHWFTPQEVESPMPTVGEQTRFLDLYPWISEHLTKCSDFSEKPIIVGQVMGDGFGKKYLGVRIRCPHDVELMEVGLPEDFRTGGLSNTAVASVPLDDSMPPEQQFRSLVEGVWRKTVPSTIKPKKLRNVPPRLEEV